MNQGKFERRNFNLDGCVKMLRYNGLAVQKLFEWKYMIVCWKGSRKISHEIFNEKDAGRVGRVPHLCSDRLPFFRK